MTQSVPAHLNPTRALGADTQIEVLRLTKTRAISFSYTFSHHSFFRSRARTESSGLTQTMIFAEVYISNGEIFVVTSGNIARELGRPEREDSI